MIQLSLQQVADICDGRVDEQFAGVQVCGVSTDTRQLQEGSLFVALRGERHDGHDYVAAALDAGAGGAVVSAHRAAFDGRPVVYVDNTLLAFGQLGAWHRGRLDLTIVGVTGSSGKTTTKNLIGAVLSQVGVTLTAPGSENNEIGVPRVLLSLEPRHRFCVVEMAMRGPGEISYLARLVRPQIGVITNIGEAHIGRLGSRERVAQAKSELLAELPADGTAVLNADDFFYALMTEIAPCPVLSFGLLQPADVTARILDHSLDGTRFAVDAPCGKFEVMLRPPGAHNVANALAAVAVGCAVGASPEQIRVGLESCGAERMRGEVLRAPGGYTVINDAYNANPHSMAAALQTLAAAGGRRIAVLGDMLELGERSERAHRELGHLAADRGVDWLVTVGAQAALAAEEAARRGVRADATDSADAALALLRQGLREGDTVLVKASRGIALEHVVEGLLEDG